MNTAIVREHRDSKRPPLSNSPAIALLRRSSETKIFFSDDLRQRWEQIVSKGRS